MLTYILNGFPPPKRLHHWREDFSAPSLLLLELPAEFCREGCQLTLTVVVLSGVWILFSLELLRSSTHCPLTAQQLSHNDDIWPPTVSVWIWISKHRSGKIGVSLNIWPFRKQRLLKTVRHFCMICSIHMKKKMVQWTEVSAQSSSSQSTCQVPKPE